MSHKGSNEVCEGVVKLVFVGIDVAICGCIAGPYSYGELNYCDRLHILITFIYIITPLLHPYINPCWHGPHLVFTKWLSYRIVPQNNAVTDYHNLSFTPFVTTISVVDIAVSSYWRCNLMSPQVCALCVLQTAMAVLEGGSE